MLRNLRAFGHTYEYTLTNKPVYRGYNPKKQISKDEDKLSILNDYKLNSIGYWPCF